MSSYPVANPSVDGLNIFFDHFNLSISDWGMRMPLYYQIFQSMHYFRFLTWVVLVAGFSLSLQAQNYGTRAGKITFYSDTPLEKIEAKNESASAVLNAATGDLQFSVQIKGFQFAKATMQEHFNENYMESGQFPNATFKGKVVNMSAVNLAKDGTYPVVVKGTMTMHGVSKPIETKGQLAVAAGVVTATSTFFVTAEDYQIKIPAVVREKIAKTIQVKVNCALKKM